MTAQEPGALPLSRLRDGRSPPCRAVFFAHGLRVHGAGMTDEQPRLRARPARRGHLRDDAADDAAGRRRRERPAVAAAVRDRRARGAGGPAERRSSCSGLARAVAQRPAAARALARLRARHGGRLPALPGAGAAPGRRDARGGGHRPDAAGAPRWSRRSCCASGPSAGFWACALAGCALVARALPPWQGGGRLSRRPMLLLLAVRVQRGHRLRRRRARVAQRCRRRAGDLLGAGVSLPLTLPAALWLWPDAPVRASAWGGFVYVTLFSMWLGFFAWYRGLALGGMVRVSQVQLVQPFLALLFAVPVLGERLEATDRGLRARGDCRRVRRQAHAGRLALACAQEGSRMTWTMARRAERLNPSTIREILKITERPGIISLAGGLPSADTFPVEAMREASARVLRDCAARGAAVRRERGLRPAARMGARRAAARTACTVDASQVLITTGSQQGLDLVGKVLIDAGSRVAVETPDLPRRAAGLRAVRAEFVPVDRRRRRAAARRRCGARARRALRLPAAELPEPERALHAATRGATRWWCGAAARPADRRGQPVWRPLVRRAAAGAAGRARGARAAVYLGSFSKVLAPGLRLGYVVAPKAAVPEAAAGQAGGRPAHAGLQPAHRARGHQGRLPARPCADDPRALPGAARCDAQRARAPHARRLPLARASGRHVLLGRVAGAGSTPPRCCRRRWPRAWPTCRARRSTADDAAPEHAAPELRDRGAGAHRAGHRGIWRRC